MQQRYNYAFFDEASKREIRRALIKGVSIPGYQVPFASREMPIGRGWGTGGLQITLAIIGPDDTLKVIDQGSDDSVNAVNIKKLVVDTTDVEVTDATKDATLIQSRHRIPEHPLDDGQILVLQVPTPEPLRSFEPSEAATKRLHAASRLHRCVAGAVRTSIVVAFPMPPHRRRPSRAGVRPLRDAPSPIPRFDNLKLNQARHLTLLGAGREKKIYAVPPFTDVVPLDFEDYPFAVERFDGKSCRRCGATGVYLDELVDEATGETYYQCNDHELVCFVGLSADETSRRCGGFWCRILRLRGLLTCGSTLRRPLTAIFSTRSPLADSTNDQRSVLRPGRSSPCLMRNDSATTRSRACRCGTCRSASGRDARTASARLRSSSATCARGAARCTPCATSASTCSRARS